MVGKQHSSDYILSAINHYKKTGNYSETCAVFDSCNLSMGTENMDAFKARCYPN